MSGFSDVFYDLLMCPDDGDLGKKASAHKPLYSP